MSGVRDYLAWHEKYNDPGSSLPRRLALVREVLRAELDARPGPVRVVSLCAGDGRDILGVLAEREDAARVSVTLVEVLPQLVERARDAAANVAAGVEVVNADAGCSATYTALATVPADVVLLVGVLGNINDGDVAATLAAMPCLCAPGATVVWTRGRSLDGAEDFVSPVREAFSDAGFTEVSIRSFDVRDDRTALGVVSYDGPPAPIRAAGDVVHLHGLRSLSRLYRVGDRGLCGAGERSRYGHRSACGAAAAGGFHSRASNGARGEDLVVGMGMDDQNDRPAQVWFDRHDREADAHDVLPPFSGAQHRCVHVRHSMVTALTDAWH